MFCLFTQQLMKLTGQDMNHDTDEEHSYYRDPEQDATRRALAEKGELKMLSSHHIA